MYNIGNKFYLITLLLFSCIILNAQTYYTDSKKLVTAVNGSPLGGVFIVKNGTYNDFDPTFSVVATELNPIIIKAETVGGVKLTGESNMVLKKSAHVTLEGFVFDGTGDNTLVKLEGCHHIRITRNVFELKTTESIKWVFVGGVWNDNVFPFEFPSHHNRIDHNIFQNKTTPGNYITIDGSNDATTSKKVYYQSQYDQIDHNYFKNNGPRAVNEQESIRIGWSEMSLSSGFTTVDQNLFEDCDGDPEIISVKTCDNIIGHNTFIGSYGTVSLRHGNRNRIEGNYFFGNGKPIGTSATGSKLYTGGIRIYGTDHMVINNYMEGLNGTKWDAPITLTLGDAIDGQSTSLSKHFRAERVTIAYNTLVNNSFGIEIGFDNNKSYNNGLKNIVIANNLITGTQNSLVKIVDNDQGDNIVWKNNLMFPTASATLLSGQTSTSFDATEVVNENPKLVYNDARKIWTATSNTPLYTNSITSETIAEDIDGQVRPTISNPGADHFSATTIRYAPLKASDVGPNAYEDISSSVFDFERTSAVLTYPVPANQILHLKNLDGKTNRIEIVTIEGRPVLSLRITHQAQDISLDTSTLVEGWYVVRMYSSDRDMISRKIIVQH